MKSLKKDWAERLISRSTCKKVHVTTEPMGNAGFRALQKVRACRAAPQNLLDFAFAGKKVRTEPKDSANFKAER